MATFTSSKHLVDLFGGFIATMQSVELRGFSGTGLVMAYTVTEPDARFVLDGREPATPGRSFAFYINDANAPPADVEIYLTADTLDKMYAGELNVMAAAAQGKIRSTGDRLAALRTLPVMFRLTPQYKAYRAAHLTQAVP